MVSRRELAALRTQYPDLPWHVNAGGADDPSRVQPASGFTHRAGWLRVFAARFAGAPEAARGAGR